MSSIISFKTDSFVSIAADKRTTTFDNGVIIETDDTSTKVQQINNIIYATAGHAVLGDRFERGLHKKNIRSFADFLEFLNDYVDYIENLRAKDENLHNVLRFVLHAVSNESRGAIAYLKIIPSTELPVVVTCIPNTYVIPTFSVPNIGTDEARKIEKYIRDNHPKSINEAYELSKRIIQYVHGLDETVSNTFDFKYLVIR